MKKRTSQDSIISHPARMLGATEIRRCNDCGRYKITLCQETGNKIKWPISGPIPDDCPLPRAGREEDADEITA